MNNVTPRHRTRFLAVALVCTPLLSSPQSTVADDLEAEQCNLALEFQRADPVDVPSEIHFQPSQGRDCHRYRRRRVCEGPRKVPIVSKAAATRQMNLGLRDSAKVGAKLLLGPPSPKWIAAAPKDFGRSLRLPVDDGIVWRGPGRRGRGHKGVDIGAAEGTLIRAARSGLVVYSDNTIRGYGNLIAIVHADSTVAFYAHNLENHVVAGETVKRGQVVGRVGQTGLARGAHLHFELRRSGRATNPIAAFVPQPVFR